MTQRSVLILVGEPLAASQVCIARHITMCAHHLKHRELVTSATLTNPLPRARLFRMQFSAKSSMDSPPPKTGAPSQDVIQTLMPSHSKAAPSTFRGLLPKAFMTPPPLTEGPWFHDAHRARKRIAGQGVTMPKQMHSRIPVAGFPPPPAAALGDAYSLAGHYYRWNPSTTLAAQFLPNRFSVFLGGRPVQVITLTHNRSDVLEYDPFLAWSFRPLRPIALLGVSAGTTESPRMKKHHCVIEWWKEGVCFLL
jgi:hypothetical protein